MNRRPALRAVDAFRSAVPVQPDQVSSPGSTGELTVCSWNTPWIKGFDIPENDDLTIAVHRAGLCDVRSLEGDIWSSEQSAPGQMTCIPPGRLSRFRVGGAVGFETIHVPRERLFAVAKRNALGERIPSFRFAFMDAFVSACVEAILGEARSPGLKSEEFIRSVTESMLLHVLRSHATQGAGLPQQASAPIDLARALINSSLASGISLQEMAEQTGISRSHFARRFRAETGLSPHQYQIRQRVEKAKQMLLETPVSLVDIAIDMGFCSQSHFTQVFRSLAGVTPRQFRHHCIEPIQTSAQARN